MSLLSLVYIWTKDIVANETSECQTVISYFLKIVFDFFQIEPFFKNTGIRVLTFCPGGTATPLTYNLEVKTYDLKMGPEFAKIVDSEGGPVIQK